MNLDSFDLMSSHSFQRVLVLQGLVKTCVLVVLEQCHVSRPCLWRQLLFKDLSQLFEQYGKFQLDGLDWMSLTTHCCLYIVKSLSRPQFSKLTAVLFSLKFFLVEGDAGQGLSHPIWQGSRKTKQCNNLLSCHLKVCPSLVTQHVICKRKHLQKPQ